MYYLSREQRVAEVIAKPSPFDRNCIIDDSRWAYTVGALAPVAPVAISVVTEVLVLDEQEYYRMAGAVGSSVDDGDGWTWNVVTNNSRALPSQRRQRQMEVYCRTGT